jgi:tetratricopeptide (TPR) repeat protein
VLIFSLTSPRLFNCLSIMLSLTESEAMREEQLCHQVQKLSQEKLQLATWSSQDTGIGTLATATAGIKSFYQDVIRKHKLTSQQKARLDSAHHTILQCFDPNYIQPDFFSAISYFERGVIAAELKEHRAAIADFDRAIRIYPQGADVYYCRALSSLRCNDYDSALAGLDCVIRLAPTSAVAYTTQGKVHARRNDHSSAVNSYSRAIQFQPRDSNAYRHRGLSMAALNQHTSAIKDYDQAIELNPRLADTYYEKGLALNALNDRHQAIEQYSQAIKLDTRFTQAYWHRARCHYAMKTYQGAIHDLNAVVRLIPNNAEAYRERGIVKSVLGNHQGASDDFSLAIDKDPSCADAYYRRGCINLATKNYKGAVDDAKCAIGLKFHIQTSNLLCQAEAKLDAQQQTAAPDLAGVGTYNKQAEAKAAQGYYLDAIDYYTDAIRVHPTYASYLGRAEVKRMLQHHQSAIHDYNYAIHLDPCHDLAYKNRALSMCAVNDMVERKYGIEQDDSQQMQAGMNIDARNSDHKWTRAKIVSREGVFVLVHFEGSKPQATACLHIVDDSDRIGLYDELTSDSVKKRHSYHVNQSVCVQLPKTEQRGQWVAGTVEEVDGIHVRVQYSVRVSSGAKRAWFNGNSRNEIFRRYGTMVPESESAPDANFSKAESDAATAATVQHTESPIPAPGPVTVEDAKVLDDYFGTNDTKSAAAAAATATARSGKSLVQHGIATLSVESDESESDSESDVDDSDAKSAHVCVGPLSTVALGAGPGAGGPMMKVQNLETKSKYDSHPFTDSSPGGHIISTSVTCTAAAAAAAAAAPTNYKSSYYRYPQAGGYHHHGNTPGPQSESLRDEKQNKVALQSSC